jgi:hypothetical protein
MAIYQVPRDGIPGTAMPSADLPLRELLQVTAHVKMLQAHLSEDHKAEASRLAIQVSNERLQAAGTNTDEWLTNSGSYNGWRHTASLKLRMQTSFSCEFAGSNNSTSMIRTSQPHRW